MPAAKVPLILAALATVFLTVGGVFGDDDDHDHDRALRAVRAGTVLPMARALERVTETFPGQVLEVEFEEEDGVPVYEFKVVTPRGNVVEIEMDARDLSILEVEGDDEMGER